LSGLSRLWVGEGDIRNCFGKLNDPGKPALRRLGILPQQLRASPLSPSCPSIQAMGLRRRAWRQGGERKGPLNQRVTENTTWSTWVKPGASPETHREIGRCAVARLSQHNSSALAVGGTKIRSEEKPSILS